MKICFIWVSEFRTFSNFGINLSSSLKFLYDQDLNCITHTDAQSLPESFFGTNISDVIGIIGKNGAGKSNAVELICKILKGGKTSLNSDFLIVFEYKGKLHCQYSFSNGLEPASSFPIKKTKYSSGISPLKVVFFSNVFDGRETEFDKEVSDISVNKQYHLTKRPFAFRKKEITDFEKQIKLFSSSIFPSLEIHEPEDVLIKSKVWLSRFNTSSEERLFGNYINVVRTFKKIFRDKIKSLKPHYKFVSLIRFSFFFQVVGDALSNAYSSNNEIKFALDHKVGAFLSSLDGFRYEDTEKMMEFLEENIMEFRPLGRNWDLESNDDLKSDVLNQQILFLKNLRDDYLHFDYKSEGLRSRNYEYFILPYNSPGTKKFINKYVSLFAEMRDFEISWLGLSSGHRAYLNLFASLYQELRYTRTENLILCIDEGDLYLHPKWQVEYFDKLLSSLPKIFDGSIQLVLTSHSPFLLSDLPKQNITILGKNGLNEATDGNELEKNTFGGNLYNLYSEPFFLGSKRTSDFAFNKIKNVIDVLEKGELSSSDKKKIKQIVDLLGDEVIQYRINKELGND